jgi:hypothetical protein
MMPIAFLSAGPLADFVFDPMLQEGGWLANTIVAQIVGVGPGRGIGLIFIIAGLGSIIATWLVYANPKIRHLESDIPDVVKDSDVGEEETPPLANEAADAVQPL